MATQHWVDTYVDRIIREKGDRSSEPYTCASGITPSGTVHIGNFREIISVDLIVRGLRDRDKPVRFIYSWDDYDVFRKVPKDVPDPEAFAAYLRMPITMIPDPLGREANYALAHERELEEVLVEVGIEPEYIYQAERYRSSIYAEGIRTALEKRDVIRRLLDEHRSSPLPEEWWPVSVFSTFTDKDTTTVLDWDGDWGLRYRCDETGNEETLDLRTSSAVKLPWRIDWPMRWAHERVDFEPAGKDHHSEGGSFDTAENIVREVYGFEPPVSFQYDFIGVKGRGGKISSSAGGVVSLRDVLEIYQPEVVRYLFAGTRPNSEFSISFDLDVIKIYEDYDRCERAYYGAEQIAERRREKERRSYELSQLAAPSAEMPVQIPFRHLCNRLQIAAGDVAQALEEFGPLEGDDLVRAEKRAACAWNWITSFAPEDFRFHLKSAADQPIELGEHERRALTALRNLIRDRLDEHDEKSLNTAIYDIARAEGLEPKDFFRVMYQVLVGKEKGPRLAGFVFTIGRERILEILDRYPE